jgi:glutathione S-transferase
MGSLGSPFVRKVRILATIKGIALDMVETEAGQPKSGNLRNLNPLKKVPVLVLDDGTQLFDSHVICEYLDSLNDTPRLIPAHSPARWQVLRTAALADGILEAAILAVYEKRFRPEDKWVPAWVEMQLGKANAGLDWLEKNVPSATPDYAAITVAAALGFIDKRIGDSWRASHPALAAWFDRFTTSSAWVATQPQA